MNCKISHGDNSITFIFDTKDFQQTLCIFDKNTKMFSFSNRLEFYGYGECVTVKQMEYVLKYLKKGGFV